MENERTDGIDLRTASTEEILRAMARGVRSALEEHKRNGRSIVVWDWKEDRVASVPPDRIEASEETPPRANDRAEVDPVSLAAPVDPPAAIPHHS